MPFATDQQEILNANKRANKAEESLKEATKILKKWDKYGEDYGCMNDTMNQLFIETELFLVGEG